jgi:hypothetical protein
MLRSGFDAAANPRNSQYRDKLSKTPQEIPNSRRNNCKIRRNVTLNVHRKDIVTNPHWSNVLAAGP